MSDAVVVPDAESAVKGSSFYWPMRLLPEPRRSGIFEVYAFCRVVDDIADDDGPIDARRAALAGWRDAIGGIYAGRTPKPRLAGLAASIRQFQLRREDFEAVIDGMAMDLDGPIIAPDLATLDLYCDRVASAVGRLCVRIFGMDEADGVALARHLGQALQLTNILRDIDEDADIGRVYLPREALDGAGVTTRDPAAIVSDPRLPSACESVVTLARGHFKDASAIMNRARLKHASAIRTPRLMGDAYGLILDRLERRGFAAPRERVRLGKPTLVRLLLRVALPW
jgi:squalene synthase HpnD